MMSVAPTKARAQAIQHVPVARSPPFVSLECVAASATLTVGTSRAWRMILAHHSLDRHAQQQVTDEHDGCADCWQDTAVAAVDAAGSLLISSGPLPEMDTSGVVTGPTVNWLLRVIDGCLRAEELDRREVYGSDR